MGLTFVVGVVVITRDWAPTNPRLRPRENVYWKTGVSVGPAIAEWNGPKYRTPGPNVNYKNTAKESIPNQRNDRVSTQTKRLQKKRHKITQ